MPIKRVKQIFVTVVDQDTMIKIIEFKFKSFLVLLSFKKPASDPMVRLVIFAKVYILGDSYFGDKIISKECEV